MIFSEDIEYFMGLYEKGDFPIHMFASFLMEYIPDEGGKAAFEQLPQELQDAVIALIRRYQKGGELIRIGAEMQPRDMASVAERFIKEVLGESVSKVSPPPK